MSHVSLLEWAALDQYHRRVEIKFGCTRDFPDGPSPDGLVATEVPWKVTIWSELKDGSNRWEPVTGCGFTLEFAMQECMRERVAAAMARNAKK